MSNPTPGPWRVSKFEESSGGPTRTVMGADDCAVAWLGDRSEDEHVADSRLIAAAPELLEAAQKVWDAREEAFDDTVGNYYGPLARALLSLKNAIEKAGGVND